MDGRGRNFHELDDQPCTRRRRGADSPPPCALLSGLARGQQRFRLPYRALAALYSELAHRRPAGRYAGGRCSRKREHERARSHSEIPGVFLMLDESKKLVDAVTPTPLGSVLI